MLDDRLAPMWQYVASSSRVPRSVTAGLWQWYWHVWLNVRYWAYWPVANPRLFRLMVRVLIGVAMVCAIARTAR